MNVKVATSYITLQNLLLCVTGFLGKKLLYQGIGVWRRLLRSIVSLIIGTGCVSSFETLNGCPQRRQYFALYIIF
ncbi:MAG: hypothetical protein LLG02_09930 [Pelosinus sp.]|nr:hypothetical protein [Pelosinus sp.]